MASDSRGAAVPGDASLVPRLAAVLAAAAEATEAAHASAPGDGPTPRELAELLWLAQQLGPVEAPAVARATAPAAAPPVDPVRDTETEVPTEQGATDVVPPKPRAPQPDPSPAAPRDDRVPLHMPAPPSVQPERAADGPSLLAPAPPMLKRPLALQRALRPLKRRVPSPHARVLDERATADRIARLGAHPDAWLPVLRPAPDRWLRLSLVHDTGPTMPVWRPLVRELHTALAQSGFFRTVTLHPATPDGRARHVPDLADGRTVTLVVSDCMGPQWRPGPAGRRWYETLRRWALRMPLAVVQPLPERLWPTTTLPAEPGLLTAPATAAATAALAFAPYDADAPPPRAGAVLLPVLEPGPKWLAHWAGLIADPGGGRTPGAAAWLPPAPTSDTEPAPDIASLPPDDLFRHFRATATPEAFRLAGHLALAVPSVPVMRLVQHTLLRDPRPQHLAEVILSGMLTAVPGPPGSYDFRPGVRDLLMRTLPRTARERAREFLARVGGLIDERAGFAAGEFRAHTGNDGDADTPFATVSEETVQRLGGGEDQAREGTEQGLLGGRYRPVERRGPGQRMWTAVDVATDQLVALHLYREQTAPQDRFLREAQALAAIDDPHVVRVLSYGVEGEVPYLVTEFVDGVTLAELQRGSGPGVAFGLFARLASQVGSGLHALHERGLVHGPMGTAGLLLRPDGTVVISRFALGDESLGKDATSDFHELNALLRDLVPLVTAPGEYRELLAEIGNGRLTAEAAASRLARAQDPDSWSFGMLGPLRITLPDEPVITVPISEAQAMLCMLVLRHGRRITYPELAQGMWEQPPTGPEAVRRIDLLASEVLGRLGPGTVAALPDGYALHVPGAFVDVLHCEDLLSGAPGEQDARTRRAEIRRALDLWYGPPLDGIPGPAAEATRARVNALRLSLRAAGAELDLELGHLASATTDLEVLVRDHPDQVHLRRLHMLALRGQGRIAEAVASYESYAELRERDGDPIDAALEVLYRELLSAPSASRGSDDDALTSLRELVEAATVRVHHPASGDDLDEPATFIASGFFAAPNWVVTSAHVASRAVGNDVTVVYESAPDRSTSAVPGRVAAILPELALVRLTEPVQHECAYLSERPTALHPGDWMLYAGWAETDGQVHRQDGSLAVQGSIAGRSGAARMHLAHDDLPHGLSGGPVIDPVRGEVVGVLTTRPDHVRGGTCVGISELRALPVSAVNSEHADLYQAVFHAHDRYHRDRQRQPDITRPTWAELQDQLGARPGRMLTTYERTELLGLLADLPPPVSTRSLVDILASVQERRTPTPLPAPRGWRDGLGVLYESTRRREPVLEFAMQALSTDRAAGDGPRTSGAEEALWQWVMQAAQPLGTAYRQRLAHQRIERLQSARSKEASRPGPDYRTGSGPQQPTRSEARPSGTILLELTERGFEPGRVDWRIALLDTTRDEVLPLAEGFRTSLEALAPTLVTPLAEAFRRFDEPGHPATLEVATPARLLDLPVDAWRLVPSDDRPLGATRPIVTRWADLLPDEDSELAVERLARWRALHTRVPAPELLGCPDGIAMPRGGVESLRALPPTTIPVLCGMSHVYAAETDALSRLLLAGFPIVLWRRHRRTAGAGCGEYHWGIHQTLASTRGVAELPQALLDVRARTAAGDPDVHWSDGLMLMYDDPTRPLPGAGDLLEAP
ncbi:SAV_2336 N-terminal domain-related protein [Streptomyces sp. NPDC001406]|uniref:SAV_2336 N-terminal domain-related protein n=1 Tax=Streptomyces sp. NPDC001406 TaxID=3364572 RepID=UPI0036A36888